MKRHLTIYILLLLSIPLIIAPPTNPTTQVSESGLIIEYPKYAYVAKDTAFTLHFHVFNSTDYVTNQTTTCGLHLYSPLDKHIFEGWADFEDNGLDFEIDINANNFSMLGDHAYIIYCNSSQEVGYASGSYTVTTFGLEPAGDNLTIFIYLLFMIMTIGLLSMFILTLTKLTLYEVTIYNIIANFAFYLGLILNYYIARAYLLDSFIVDNVTMYMTASTLSAVFFPIVAFFVSVIHKSTQKRTVPNPQEMLGRGFF